MKRKEEIRQEANRKYPYEGGIKGMICENSIPIFIQGAEWADKTMIEKAHNWIKANMPNYINFEEGFIYEVDMADDLRKYLEE